MKENLISLEAPAKLSSTVTPAKAEVQKTTEDLDSCFRRNDAECLLQEALFHTENQAQRGGPCFTELK